MQKRIMEEKQILKEQFTNNPFLQKRIMEEKPIWKEQFTNNPFLQTEKGVSLFDLGEHPGPACGIPLFCRILWEY